MMKSRYRLIGVFYGFSLVVFFILRTALLVISRYSISHTVQDYLYIFLTGFLFDTVFLLYASVFFALILLVVPDSIYNTRLFGWLTHGILLFLTVGLFVMVTAEWLFWNEFGVRFNFIAVDYLVYRHEVTRNIYESYPVGAISCGVVITSLAGYRLFLYRPVAEALACSEPFRRRCLYFFVITGLAGTSFFWVHNDLRRFSVNNYTNELAGNGGYQIVAAFRHNTLDYRHSYALGNDAELSSLLKQSLGKPSGTGGLYDISRPVANPPRPVLPNVILITVESLSACYLGRFGNTQGITPFLDDWFKSGVLFTQCYATGTRTTRGLEALTLSIPPTPGRSIVKRPDNGRMHTIGKVFQDNGYDIAFIYGGRGYFDNMNAFYSGNGYRVVDQAIIPDTEIYFENAWGVADEVVYDQVIKEASAASRKQIPFFFHVMTTSNHRPYTYPPGRIDIPPGLGRAGAVKYTDYALGRFAAQAREHSWFSSTIVVVVADHCASSAGRIGLPIERYHIPLFFYGPGLGPGREVDTVCCQIDIGPTLLSLAGISYTSWFFGNDLFSSTFRPRTLGGNYQKLGLYQDDVLTILSPGQLIHQIISPHTNNDTMKSAKPTDPLVRQTMMYYQGADHILRNRLNRW